MHNKLDLHPQILQQQISPNPQPNPNPNPVLFNKGSVEPYGSAITVQGFHNF